MHRPDPSAAAITVFFDGACPLCRREVALYRRLAGPGAIGWIDLAGPDALAAESFTLDAALTLLHVRDAAGVLHVGLPAHLQLWARLPGWRGLAWVLARSGRLQRIADAGYRWFTARRPGLRRRRRPAMAERPDIAWRDLLPQTRLATARELALPLPWLGLAWLAAAHGWTLAAVGASFVLFMTGLRVTHGAFHRALGLRGRGNDVVMFVLSVLLGGAMHAIECTHRHHHRACLGDDDIEGHIAHLGFLRALLHSPAYPLRIHVFAWRHGSVRQRRWLRAELGAVVMMQLGVWCVFDSAALQTIVLALVFANASAAMVGIWAVHRACDGVLARSSRSRLLDVCVAGMFHHLEHHLWPAVPTARLPELARRFDAARRAPIRTVAGGSVPPP